MRVRAGCGGIQKLERDPLYAEDGEEGGAWRMKSIVMILTRRGTLDALSVLR